MGSYTYGKWQTKCNPTTDDHIRLDIRVLQKKNGLESGQTHNLTYKHKGNHDLIIVKTEADQIIINCRYRQDDGEWYTVDQPVKIARIPCPYGGKQVYFICPTCDRRVCSLYKVDGIACRKCHRLIYASQSQRCDDRWEEQANKIRKKLGWKLGTLSQWGDRPRYMHEQTYQALVMKLLHYTRKINNHMQKQIDKWHSNSIHELS